MSKQSLTNLIADQSLQESDMRAHALFTQTHDAVFLTSLDRVFLDVNPQAAALLGYSQQELIGMDSRRIIIPDEQEASANTVDTLLSGEDVPLYERRVRHRDGHEIPVEVNISLVRDQNGQPLYTQAMVRDITQRKQAEAALREREQHYSALFSHTHDAVFLISLDGIHLEVNPQAAILLGYSEQELVGMPTTQIVAPQEHPDSAQTLEKLL
ncbi:MAG: PAS domain S-box protein, partial [Acidobacteriales bacterium]|nr:PAS domain S-box protein [Terriglobales bacterium]